MKKPLLLILLSLVTAVYANSQNIQIEGKVTSEGAGLPGVNILIKGTNEGTITDFDGSYKISVPDQSAILVFSFIGFKEKEVQVGSQTVIDVSLDDDLMELNEVVVIGYGVQKKKVVTGAIESVSAEEVTSTPVLRVEQALQGRTPGVQVTNLSGQPGEAPTVRIRGAGTTGNAAPLYVVDGLVVGGIDYLNPGDIESMDVLKDAASAAIYGARAANGVVLITTKQGIKGRLSVSYDGYTAIQNAANRIDMLNAEQYRELMNEGAANAGRTLPFDLNEIPDHNTDWQEELFEKNAPMFSHQISVAGGGEKSTFASSISYFSQEGIIGGDKSQFDRVTARLNSTHKVNSKFNFGNNLAYSHIIRRGIASNSSFNGAFSSALNMDPLTPVFETDPNRLSQYPFNSEPVVTTPDGVAYGISELVGAEVVNPLALLENTNGETRVDKLVGNIYGEIVPIEGLSIRSSLGIDLAYVLNDSFRPLFFLNGAQLNDNKTSVSKNIDRYFTWQWENYITYSKTIQDHSFSVLAGTTAQEDRFEGLFGFNTEVPVTDPDNVYLNQATDTAWQARGGADHHAIASIYGRITYDYKDRYSFTGIIRRDGSSNFGSNSRYGIFPSVGAAWVISDENFMKEIGVLDYLKLRASYGVNGNEDIGRYQYLATIDQTRGYTFGTGRVVGSSPAYIENADIQWEESEQIGVGIDYGFFGNQLTGSIDLYQKSTYKLLERVSVPGHVGNEPPFANVGSVRNKGIELNLNWRKNSADLNYSIGLNAAYNQNEILNLENDFIPGASWAIAGQVTRNQVGLPIAYFWGYQTDGIFQNEGEVFSHINNDGDLLQRFAVPGDVRFVDVNGDGVIDADDRTIIGNPTPDWTVGFTASIEYKNFDFMMLVNGALGHEIFNGTQRQDLEFTNRTTRILDRWTGEGTSTTIPRFTFEDTNNNYRVSDLYIEDGSFLRLNNVQIGYNLPSKLMKKIGAVKARFYVSGENLVTLTGYTGANPEIGAINSFDIGIDRAVYPLARTWRVGTSITF